ncbi:Gfo/Idh/MocA family oxidoreductase [uncultured Jannaschia sp.]|uniref:Gfo/Idh/MocA family protein n=1 Tax=uncultured Jannaschia sp. TaxID=293347 RepID=UPI0026237419|nr:Gfo/Idh/MocA family oxidoreductase [uncultured Jannaschia sp.]
MPHTLALVGIGEIARNQHVPALQGTGAFTLAATASRNAGVEGIDGYRNLASLLDARADVTCVSLCTPPQFRYEDARLALEQGRHVMLEKPPGATLSEVEALIDLARARGVTLYASWHSRAAAAVPAARDWLADRRVRNVSMTWKEDVRHWHPGQDWIWQAGGLGVFDPGINGFSILTAILPHPLRLTAAELRFPENRDTPVAADLAFAGPDGLRAQAALDWLETGEPKWDIVVATESGTLTLSKGGAEMAVDGVPVPVGENREYPNLYARFAELIDRGERDADLAPLRLVADAFMLGRRVAAPAFRW